MTSVCNGKMPITLTLVAVAFGLPTGHAFSFPSHHVVHGLPSLSNRKLLIRFAEGSDKYASLVEAYQKKPTLPETPVPDVTPVPPVVHSTPPLPPVVDTPKDPTPAKQFVKTFAERLSGESSKESPSLADFFKGKADAVARSRAAAGGGPPTNNKDFDRVANAKEKWALFQENYSKLASDITSATSDTKEKIKLIKEDSSRLVPDLSAVTQNEKVTLLKANSDKLVNSLDEATLGPRESLAGMAATAKGAGAKIAGSGAAKATAAAVAGGTMGAADILDKLRLQEYGGWYFAILALVLGIAQRNAGKEEAKKQFAEALASAEGKALEAVEAAMIASQASENAKTLAKEAMNRKGVSTESILDKSKLKELEVEQMMTLKELQKLEQENAKLRSELGLSTPTTKEEDLSPPPASVTEETPSDPDEEARILDIIKEVDDENKVAKKKKKKTLKGASKAVEMNNTPKPKKKAKKAKAKKKAAPKQKVVAESTSSSDNPWSSLSDATLKRKTVKVLSEYLAERGVPVADENGKTLLKADLVSAIKSL